MEHDEEGHLLRQSSQRSRRRGSRSHYGTLRKKPSQLATVTDEDVLPNTGSYEMHDAAGGTTSNDPLYQYAPGSTRQTAVQANQGWGQSSRQSHGEDEYDDDDSLKGREMVRPHPPVRWDDTPNNTARYNNPFYNQDMDDFLWLPRNPLAPVDLFDTIEWYGPALVSSQEVEASLASGTMSRKTRTTKTRSTSSTRTRSRSEVRLPRLLGRRTSCWTATRKSCFPTSSLVT